MAQHWRVLTLAIQCQAFKKQRETRRVQKCQGFEVMEQLSPITAAPGCPQVHMDTREEEGAFKGTKLIHGRAGKQLALSLP